MSNQEQWFMATQNFDCDVNVNVKLLYHFSPVYVKIVEILIRFGFPMTWTVKKCYI